MTIGLFEIKQEQRRGGCRQIQEKQAVIKFAREKRNGGQSQHQQRIRVRLNAVFKIVAQPVAAQKIFDRARRDDGIVAYPRGGTNQPEQQRKHKHGNQRQRRRKT